MSTAAFLHLEAAAASVDYGDQALRALCAVKGHHAIRAVLARPGSMLDGLHLILQHLSTHGTGKASGYTRKQPMTSLYKGQACRGQPQQPHGQAWANVTLRHEIIQNVVN